MFSFPLNVEGLPKKRKTEPLRRRSAMYFVALKKTSSISPLESLTITLSLCLFPCPVSSRAVTSPRIWT